jgi:hypothetical protein
MFFDVLGSVTVTFSGTLPPGKSLPPPTLPAAVSVTLPAASAEPWPDPLAVVRQ